MLECTRLMDDNLELQIDEIEALIAIYGDEVEVLDSASRSYLLQVCSNSLYTFSLQVHLPPTYPTDSPPKFEFRAPWLKSHDRTYLRACLDDLYTSACGNGVLYSWIEFIKDFIKDKFFVEEEEQTVVEESAAEPSTKLPTFDVVHGEVLIDRRSSFQAHLASTNRIEQVKEIQQCLLENRKFSKATHNILAYRIYKEDTGIYLQDCDDDGETAAGRRLLHLLQILDVKNVVVVVSRWYGGIKLGADRFKHINNVARDLLVREGYVLKIEDKKNK